MKEHKGSCFHGCFRWFSQALVLSLLLFMAEAGHCEKDRPFSGVVKAFRVGIAAHDVDGLWSGSSKEEGPDLCAEIVFDRRLFRLLSATAYPNAGITINTQGDTSKLYGGFLLQWGPFSSLFFSTGLGLALHNGETDTQATDKKSLGSRVLFRIPLEIGLAVSARHRFALAFDHISNAYLRPPNEGMDTLGLMYSFQF